MSRTLFFYIFKDLIKIFLLTSGALAGIMSFGGLLRPLTEHGLNAAQAVKMLSYFMPAMTTYSLPIAALFATTVVYGRLAADNELVACRAAGISFFSIGLPGLVLGLAVALISLLFLCFIVPVFTLKVERVIYSNLAQLISNEIDRTHQIKFQDTTIFAQEAAVVPESERRPDEQIVRLGGIMIVAYEKVDSTVPNTRQLQVPKEFYLAKQATVYIRRSKSDQFTLEAQLEQPGGAMFPRGFGEGERLQGGIAQTQFGPIVIDSLIREETKFMDVRRLHELYVDPAGSRKVQEQVLKITQALQEQQYLAAIARPLAAPNGVYRFTSGKDVYDLVSPKGAVAMRNDRLVVAPARLVQLRDGKPEFTWDAAEIEISARPVGEDRLTVQTTLRDVIAKTADTSTARSSFARHFIVPMPQNLRDLEGQTVDFYQRGEGITREQWTYLQRELLRLSNGIQSELHSRASFAVSCLILVVVGCALGMMFRSGNFLSAFALSVIPALVCIALIVAGQHVCENIPWKLDNFRNPLNFGIGLIWSGNAAVLVLAVALWGRLARQ